MSWSKSFDLSKKQAWEQLSHTFLRILLMIHYVNPLFKFGDFLAWFTRYDAHQILTIQWPANMDKTVWLKMVDKNNEEMIC